jgi:hypothetical protein
VGPTCQRLTCHTPRVDWLSGAALSIACALATPPGHVHRPALKPRSGHACPKPTANASRHAAPGEPCRRAPSSSPRWRRRSSSGRRLSHPLYLPAQFPAVVPVRSAWPHDASTLPLPVPVRHRPPLLVAIRHCPGASSPSPSTPSRHPTLCQ